jgi:hypothetical protein
MSDNAQHLFTQKLSLLNFISMKRTFWFFVLLLVVCTTLQAQQLSRQIASSPSHQTNVPAAPAYTYRLFQAPNKNFGYDILQNGKMIFRQQVPMSAAAQGVHPRITPGPGNMPRGNNGSTAITKREHAEKAALMVIEKIKRREPPGLTGEEIRKIISE